MTSNLDQVSTDRGQANQGLIDRWRYEMASAWRYKYLLSNLVRRDLKVRYRNSVLGILWSLLNPLLMMLVFSLVFAKLIPREDIRQYAVFFLVGLLPWQFFTGSLISGTTSITGNSQLIKKVYFPRLLLPTSATISNLVNYLIAFVLLLVLLYISGLGLTIHSLWLLPILITQIVFILGWLGETRTIMGLAFNPAVVMRWLNPMASIIDGYRTVLWGTMGSNGPAPMDPVYLLRTFATSVLIFIIGLVVFSRTQNLFGEKL